jgi:putative ubiquitin-RnfH superfamily antitoxin RatB of RatAB toxin-antitoxin module
MADTEPTEQIALNVQVCYALPDQSFVKSLQLAPGTSIAQAIEASGVLKRFPQIDLTQQRVGVFGKLKTPDTLLREGDRVEIYRPLQADPKETRRRRAAHRKFAKS